jgi:hypothetical protein
MILYNRGTSTPAEAHDGANMKISRPLTFAQAGEDVCLTIFVDGKRI